MQFGSDAEHLKSINTRLFEAMEIYLNSATILSLPAYTSTAIVTKFPEIESKVPERFDPGGAVPSAKMKNDKTC